MARKRAPKGKPFLTVDCETDPFKVGRVPEPFIWGIYDGQTNDYWEFDTPEEVATFLEDQNVIVYAHNGGKFDYHYLKPWINSNEPIMVISGRLARFKIGDAEFRDSMNILVNPLRAFAKEEIDYALLEPDVRHLHMEEIRRYLRSDCVNLWETVAKYFASYGRTMTQAGAAMKYWQKNFNVPFVRQTASQAEMCREFYYGGRVECFEIGHGHRSFSVVDINSAYPRAMLEKHPISPSFTLASKLPRDADLPKCFAVVTGVARGCFPYRDDDGSLWFPNDGETRTYSVTGWELQAALELDAFKLENVERVCKFAERIDFAGYVEHFYEERKRAKLQGDGAADVFAKLFLNSLYGKFAADPEKYQEFVIADNDTVMGWVRAGYSRVGEWCGRHLMARPLPEEKHRYYNVATAASVTGWVRAYLFRAIKACKGVMYCDTDSIAAADVSGLALGNELGQWKHELNCVEYAIAGKKTYAFLGDNGKWKTASKGVKLTPEEIVRVARGETVRYRPKVPTYSIHHNEPAFVERDIRVTYKDRRNVDRVQVKA